MPFRTKEAAKKPLRMMAAELDTSRQDLFTAAPKMQFEHHGPPPIA